MRDIRAREAVLLKFLSQHSQIVVVVIDKFTVIEKLMIEKIRALVRDSRSVKELVVVHNYFDTERYDETLLFDKIRNENFVEVFELKEFKRENVNYFAGNLGKIKVSHVLLTQLPRYQNYVVSGLSILRQALTSLPPAHPRTLLADFALFVQSVISQYVQVDAKNVDVRFAQNHGKIVLLQKQLTFFIKDDYEEVF